VAWPPGSMDEFRIDERSRLVDHVTYALREMILTHKIQAGSRLLQTELAERLGVSRTPLREAIRMLEQDGLVRISNGNRTVEVVSFTGDDLRDLYEIREVIDGLAARLLASRGMSHDAEHEIREHLDTMAANLRPLKGEPFLTAHIGFHVGVVLHCGNARLRNELQVVRMTAASLRDEFPRRVRPSAWNTEAQAEAAAARSIGEHTAVYDAIRDRDGKLAEDLAREHIRNAFDMIPPSEDGEGQLTDRSLSAEH